MPGAPCVQPVPNCGILYALSSKSEHRKLGYPSTPAAVSPLAEWLATRGTVNVEIFPGHCTHHAYPSLVRGHPNDLGPLFRGFGFGYRASLSAYPYFHETRCRSCDQGFAPIHGFRADSGI